MYVCMLMTRIQTTIKIEEGLKYQAQLYARLSNMSFSELISRVLTVHLKKHPFTKPKKRSKK